MDQYPGYTLLHTEACPEQHGTVTVLTHDVSGASVLLVENDDNNKAFGIGFGTFPSDDTGVFHILEHSVLSGSEKYPVKSPFVQLLKSSMASFLNAMTFPDKTVYPFATPNETDFFNLMDVYLNAVFRPLAMTDRSVGGRPGRDYLVGSLVDGPVYTTIFNKLWGVHLRRDDRFAQFQGGPAIYHDDYSDYSSNEPTMDGTASLTFLLARLCRH